MAATPSEEDFLLVKTPNKLTYDYVGRILDPFENLLRANTETVLPARFT